ncbi:type IV conjugative transfer system pilin TraA [Legionella septentrionalis]|uniref:type IV conjugative transfer system pilin TraA n=1 Tax=Legionella septentrionalis TaxID=2498109 RepID=UPI000F8D220E|nr:type IV conjugative transfer system pilin TraA [Legionella septentrionalis]RUQ96646.1 conjugal transfer protein TraA [Legionella septentrionalis]
MKIKKICDDASVKIYLYCRDILPFIVLGTFFYFLLTNVSYAGGTNHLSGLKADVSATFGKGSDTQYFILLAEGLGGAYAFWKTKSIPVLCGLPVLMVFTHWALR